MNREAMQVDRHQPDCFESWGALRLPTCAGLYSCIQCHRAVGWCFGAADALPEHCDVCWTKEEADTVEQSKGEHHDRT
jgi:hypothetical protein